MSPPPLSNILKSPFTSRKKSQDLSAAEDSPSFARSARSPSSSPTKSSKGRKSPTKSLRDRDQRPSSSSSSRPNSWSKATSRPPIYERDSHPLNLPPHELRRLSAMSQASDPVPMDIDSDDAQVPSSPRASTNGFPVSSPTSPLQQESQPEFVPVPPPHKVQTQPQPSPTPVPALDAEKFKNDGNSFFKAKRYAEAIKEYTKAIDADPKSATYRSNRAAAYISANQHRLALEDALAADRLDPDNPKILHRLARIYTNLGEPSEALNTYSRIHPPASAKDKAAALAMQKHLKEAETVLREATSGSMAIHALDQAERGLAAGVERPRKWRLMRGDAYLLMSNENALGEAQTIAMALLRTNKNDPEALVLRGRALYGQGENESAIQHFRQALSCDPDFKDAVKYLRIVQKLDRIKEEGNKAFKMGKYKLALETYDKALEVDPNNRGTNSKINQNKGQCLMKEKKYKEAIAAFDRALELDPSYTKAKKLRAKALGESGDWQEAVNELKKLAEANPGDASFQKEIRSAELELKKSKRKDHYKTLGVEKDAGDSEIKRAYRKLAIVHHPDKNPDDEAAADKFKEIGEAYEILSDAQKREAYDRGDDLIDPSEMFGGGGMHGGMGGGVPIDPEMLFSMFGGGMGGMPGMGGMGGPGGGRGGQTFSFSSGGGAGGNPFANMGGAGGSRGPGFQF